MGFVVAENIISRRFLAVGDFELIEDWQKIELWRIARLGVKSGLAIRFLRLIDGATGTIVFGAARERCFNNVQGDCSKNQP